MKPLKLHFKILVAFVFILSNLNAADAGEALSFKPDVFHRLVRGENPFYIQVDRVCQAIGKLEKFHISTPDEEIIKMEKEIDEISKSILQAAESIDPHNEKQLISQAGDLIKKMKTKYKEKNQKIYDEMNTKKLGTK